MIRAETVNGIIRFQANGLPVVSSPGGGLVFAALGLATSVILVVLRSVLDE